MDTITLGDLITLAGVLFAAGAIVMQVRHLDKKVDRLEKKMDHAGRERTDLDKRVSRIEVTNALAGRVVN